MDGTLHSSKRSSTVVSSSNTFYGSSIPALHDFDELFSFHSSSSIPVLDLAPSPRHDLDTRAPSTAFEYDDVFASLADDCSALSYDELLANVASHADDHELPARAESAELDDTKDDLKIPSEPLHSSEQRNLERESVDERNHVEERLKKASVAKRTDSMERNRKASGTERKQEDYKKKEDEERVTGKSVKARIAAFEQRFKKVEAVSNVHTKDNDGQEALTDDEEDTKDDIILELVENEVEVVQEKENISIQAEYEPPMRTQARLQRHKRVSDRAAQALAEKTKRDLMEERDAVERERVSEALDLEVKRWSSGKEGNLRALLSTLQYILGANSGWQAVPLTDIVAAAAVTKAYKKATLCLHPDKLQQRGASVQQKYTSEKVFDLLKVAWTIFNSEEW